MINTAQHTARETWLIAAIEHLRPLFEEAGAEIPAVRVSRRPLRPDREEDRPRRQDDRDRRERGPEGQARRALGAYPHAILAKVGDGADGPKKQGTRMVKAECASGPDEDGEVYKVRLTRTWIEKVGAPICPCHGEPMTVEGA